MCSYAEKQTSVTHGEKHYRQVLRVPPSSPDGGGNEPACEIALAPPEVRVHQKQSPAVPEARCVLSFRCTSQWLQRPSSVLNPASVSWMLSESDYMSAIRSGQEDPWHATKGNHRALTARGEFNHQMWNPKSQFMFPLLARVHYTASARPFVI